MCISVIFNQCFTKDSDELTRKTEINLRRAVIADIVLSILLILTTLLTFLYLDDLNINISLATVSGITTLITIGSIIFFSKYIYERKIFSLKRTKLELSENANNIAEEQEILFNRLKTIVLNSLVEPKDTDSEDYITSQYKKKVEEALELEKAEENMTPLLRSAWELEKAKIINGFASKIGE